MLSEKLLEVLNDENVVAIVTDGTAGAHVVNTWNNYIKVTEDERFLIPVAKMNKTENNIKENNKVLITVGSRKVDGFHSKGTGFLIIGTATFIFSGKEFEKMKQKFPWVRAVLEISIQTITQTL